MPIALTGAQKRHLRGLGHHLRAVVQVGKGGLTDALAAAVDQALTDHELIKVRVGRESPDCRDEAAEALATKLGAELVQVLGGTVLLYRRHPTEPKVPLRKPRRPASEA